MKKFHVIVCALCVLWAFSAQAATVNKIAAVVNGEMITVFDLQNTLAPELAKAKLDPQKPANKAALDALSRKALDMMILDILIAQEASKLKVTVADSEVEGEVARIMQKSKMSKPELEAQLKREGLTPDSLRDRIRKSITRQKLMGQMVGRKVVITQEEVSAYYAAHKNEFMVGKKVRMALIVYPPKVDAESWARKLKDGKTSFDQAVAAVSVGPNRQQGGEVGPVPLEEMNPTWRERISTMRPGEISNIFVIEGHKAQLFFKGMDGSGEAMSEAEATKQIENMLREPRLMERFQEYTDQLRNKAVIDIRL